jgi:Bacteriocin-protection, YdeI or OmpD-Associated
MSNLPDDGRARMGGRFLVPLSAENRTASGVAVGDQVDVGIEPDTGPREVEVPADLAEALAYDQAAQATFDGLSYTHRKECPTPTARNGCAG